MTLRYFQINKAFKYLKVINNFNYLNLFQNAVQYWRMTLCTLCCPGSPTELALVSTVNHQMKLSVLYHNNDLEIWGLLTYLELTVTFFLCFPDSVLTQPIYWFSSFTSPVALVIFLAQENARLFPVLRPLPLGSLQPGSFISSCSQLTSHILRDLFCPSTPKWLQVPLLSPSFYFTLSSS